MTLIVDLANQKGGVGKSTTTVNLARAAHLADLRTLVVDLDPQANTTSALLGSVPVGFATLAEVLSPKSTATAAEVITETGWAGVEVLPSGGDALADIVSDLTAMQTGREHRLRIELARLQKTMADEGERAYDLILMDSPPSLDPLAINGLTAAHLVVVVTEPAQWSATGIARLLRTFAGVREFTNPELRIAGVVINQWNERTVRGRHWRKELDEKLQAPVWEPHIPRAECVSRAIEGGVGLDEWGGAQAGWIASVYAGYIERLLEFAR